MISTSAPFTTQTRFPTTNKDVPQAYMGSLKAYPILPNDAIPFTSTREEPLSESLVVEDGSLTEGAAPPVAGVFQLYHGSSVSQSYFGSTWDSANELPLQKSMLLRNQHPHSGLVNRILREDDVKLEGLTYRLVHVFEMPDEFDFREVQEELDGLVKEVRQCVATRRRQHVLNSVRYTDTDVHLLS